MPEKKVEAYTVLFLWKFPMCCLWHAQTHLAFGSSMPFLSDS